MDPGTAIILSALVWAIIGLITTIIWGFDAPKFITDIGLFLILPVVFILSGSYHHIEKVTSFIEFYVTLLPGALVGDVIGSYVAKLEKPVRVLVKGVSTLIKYFKSLKRR